ncbi:MAG: hypothetical protein BGO38_09830 [Cellulomonas sp. 73-145]|uniref:hypothetical protein n=1 Tax=Cellulomonas sp. 73-145 TaxID=1895739 RepID=UPI00092799DD|nr:hypothetical protein [Cellulomonas sp. 73-145]MBN9327024.1 hypothetical protein [Cellulomonas sp.]OJV60999.1 MAG: hypothetical protein BGO38_09830 [Cellulomonas sp. 73-145]
MSRLRVALLTLAQSALVAHIVVTAFENLPPNQVSLGMRLPVFKKIPQWRFFAPNPGVEDIYLMYRTREGEQIAWSPWQDLPLQSKSSTTAMIWNPGTRKAKALFDATQQLRILAGYGSSFEWMVSSDGFHLVSDVVRATCVASKDRGEYQFMIVASMPAEGKAGLRPILVSPAAPVPARG